MLISQRLFKQFIRFVAITATLLPVWVEAESAYEPIFKEIRLGLDLHPASPLEARLFEFYLTQCAPLSYHYPTAERLIRLARRVGQAIVDHQIPPKSQMPARKIHFKDSQRQFILRPMGLWESVFAGLFGADCSTGTRPHSALEPAHLHFAIDQIPYAPLGQIEIILGHDPVSKAQLGFLERVQLPKPLKVIEFAALTHGLNEMLEEIGVALVIPENLDFHAQKAHQISNNKDVEVNLQAAIDTAFALKPWQLFAGTENLYPLHAEERFNSAAKQIEKDYPVFQITKNESPIWQHLVMEKLRSGAVRSVQDLIASLPKEALCELNLVLDELK